MSEHDVIMIGMGVGGEEVAGRLAESGLDVLAVERKLIGGECLLGMHPLSIGTAKCS